MEPEAPKKESVVTKSERRSYPIADIAAKEWKDFALYTVESRAIPNMIDGLKNVQRFYLYSTIRNSKTEFKKVAAVSGIISDYGYNHGEASAADAGKLMAAEWNNNVVLIEGRGSFGTRLVQASGAARYVYTRLHPNFDRFIKDLDLAPEHSDPEHEPPAFYLPIIPLVLANGTKGIATGFATSILPRSAKGLAKAVQEYVKTGKIKNHVEIQFPEFSGTITRDEEGKVFSNGTFERKSKTQVLITEVPYGYDREDYIAVLDKLEEEDKIVGYDDLCNKTGFRFDVKLKVATANIWDDAKIMREFKLSKPFPENLTVIDQDGKLREYNDERKLIADFCDYRLGILDQRIALRLKEYTEEVRWLSVKMAFIQAVLDDKITFKGKKKDEVAAQIINVVAPKAPLLEDDTDRLLRLNIMTLTAEQVEQLKKDIAAAKASLEYWKTTTAKDQFLGDVKELL